MTTDVLYTTHATDTAEVLSGLEKFYYMMDANTPTHPCIAIEVDGEISIDQWHVGIAKVASRSPVLFSRIVRNRGGLLVFEPISDTSLPFHVVSGDPSEWQRVMAEEVSTRIQLERGPLFRATLLHDSHRATLLLSLSHCVADGRSVLALIRDVLCTFADEPLGLPSAERSIDSLLTEATAGTWKPTLAPVYTLQSDMTPSNHEALLHLETHCFDEHLMAKLKVRAKEERATIHGAIHAALARLLGSDGIPPSGFVTSGIDVRPTLAPGEEGLRPLISSCTIKLVNERRLSFWDYARATKEVLRQQNRLEAILALHTKVAELCAAYPTPERLREYLIPKSKEPEILLTNLGVFPIPVSYGGGSIRLKSFWASINPTHPNTHFLCCSTVDGRMQVLYTSFTPLPALFDKIQNEFLAAII